MKKDLEQLKNKSNEELTKELAESRDRLWGLRQDLVRGKVKNVKEIKQAKRNIARILNILNADRK